MYDFTNKNFKREILLIFSINNYSKMKENIIWVQSIR